MSIPKQQNVWILNNPPSGPIEADTFKQEQRPLPEVKDGEVLVKIKYFSNDPAQRGWMQKDADPKRSPAPPILKGQPIRSTAIAEIVDSKSTKWKKGDAVVGRFNWFDYGVVPESSILAPAISLPQTPSASLSILGITSLTAYCGVLEVLKVKKEHIVVVSGAAGAVGSVAIQLAKHVAGAKRVVGIAGGPEKCKWVVEHLGADACVDYKAGNLDADLTKALEGKFADRVYENVGGDILNAMFTHTARHGLIGVCGTIAGYNGDKPDYSNLSQIVGNRITVQGFTVADHIPQWPEFTGNLKKFIEEGKLKADGAETVVDASFSDVPKVWQRLFSGDSRGKLVTRIV